MAAAHPNDNRVTREEIHHTVQEFRRKKTKHGCLSKSPQGFYFFFLFLPPQIIWKNFVVDRICVWTLIE